MTGAFERFKHAVVLAKLLERDRHKTSIRVALLTWDRWCYDLLKENRNDECEIGLQISQAAKRLVVLRGVY